MNDAENLVPLSLNENTVRANPQKPVNRRKALGQKFEKSSQKPRRRALGDITNSARQPLQTLQKHKQAAKPRVWSEDGQIPEPEIIPPAPPVRSYQPPPLFTAREMADMRRELEEDDDDSTDEFGRPFMTTDPIPIPPPPFEPESEDGGPVPSRERGLTSDYFSTDQLFTKEELPVLELA